MGFIDVENPRVSIVGFTQPETLLKYMKNAEEDSGGKFERFLFAAPARIMKNMRNESNVDMSTVVSLEKVKKLFVTTYNFIYFIFTRF